MPIVVCTHFEIFAKSHLQKFNRTHKNFAKTNPQNSIVTFIFSQAQTYLVANFYNKTSLLKMKKTRKNSANFEKFFGLYYYSGDKTYELISKNFSRFNYCLLHFIVIKYIIYKYKENSALDRHTPEQRRKNMQAIKNKDSKIEKALRKELWARGLRYRKNVKNVFGKPDIAFIGKKVAVFCDSEFWHGYFVCTLHKKRDYYVRFSHKRLRQWSCSFNSG